MPLILPCREGTESILAFRLDGAYASALPVPLLFSKSPVCAGKAATRKDGQGSTGHILDDAIGADEGLRMTRT